MPEDTEACRVRFITPGAYIGAIYQRLARGVGLGGKIWVAPQIGWPDPTGDAWAARKRTRSIIPRSDHKSVALLPSTNRGAAEKPAAQLGSRMLVERWG
jgi:hypothetical protein